MWLVVYSKDVDEYLQNTGWLGINLHKSIIRIFFSEDGLPAEGELTDYGDGLYWWIVAGHSLLLLHTNLETRIIDLYTSELRTKDEIEAKLLQYRGK